MNRLAPFALVLSSAALGCSIQHVDPQERVAAQEEPIYNGSQDTTDQAVVAVVGSNFLCSATIVQVSGGTGWGLTAGHCCDPNDPPQQVGQGNDITALDAIYNIVANSVTRDPSYVPGVEQNGHDFCMFQFTGANGGTPVIPVLVPQQDTMAMGSQVDIVGYGETNNNANNNLRMHKVVSIADIDGFLVGVNAPATCHGDSGGPALYNGSVAAITSFGSANDCSSGEDFSSRVSSAYATFILPYLNGQPVMQDCSGCANVSVQNGGACATEFNACIADANCKGLLQCINACAANDVACEQNCDNQFSAGLSLLGKVSTCICQQACTQVCAASCGGGTGSSSGAGPGPSASASSGGSGTMSSGSDMTAAGAGGGDGSGDAGAGGGSLIKEAGGDDSGGGCAVGAPSRETSSLAAAALLGLLAARRRRRRR